MEDCNSDWLTWWTKYIEMRREGTIVTIYVVKLITLFWKSNWLHEKEKEAIVEGNPWFWFSRPCPNWRSRLWGESLPLSGHNYNTTWVGSDGHCVAARWHRAPSAPGLDTTPGQACSIHTPPSPSSPPPPPSPPLVHSSWCIYSNSSQELVFLKWCTGCTLHTKLWSIPQKISVGKVVTSSPSTHSYPQQHLMIDQMCAL